MYTNIYTYIHIHLYKSRLELHFTVCTRFVVNKHMRYRLLPLLLLLFVGLTVICYLRQRFVHIEHIIMQTALNCTTRNI